VFFFPQSQLMLLHQILMDEACKCTKIKQSSWIFIVVNLLHLIMMGNKKEAIVSKNKLKPF
jgi:hypothetical protein